MATDNKNLLSTPLHGIYIPATLLVVGTAIVNRDWIPYAVGVALVLSGFKVYRGRKFNIFFSNVPSLFLLSFC